MKISVVWYVTLCCLADVYRLEKKSVSRKQGGKENFQNVIKEVGEQMVEEPNRKSLQ
jgi:molybdenum-dependent DNA-binding transcriptional regulator ModE